MKRFASMIAGGGAAFAAFLLLIGPINWVSSTADSPDDVPTATPTPKPCKVNDAVKVFLAEQSFGKGDYVVGEKVDWRDMYGGNTDGRFSGPLTSDDDIAKLMDADTARSRAVQRLTHDVLVGRYVAVQFLNPITYEGNWYWMNTKPIKGGERMALAGDVWWLYVAPDNCVVDGSVSIRAICGNVGFDSLTPRFVRRN